MLADLHIHTTFSDGVYTPEKIIAQARVSGIAAIAITDHDNIQPTTGRPGPFTSGIWGSS